VVISSKTGEPYETIVTRAIQDACAEGHRAGYCLAIRCGGFSPETKGQTIAAAVRMAVFNWSGRK
jgi:hypothetical protein